MKLFTIVIKYAAIIGVYPPMLGHTNNFNARNVTVLLYLASASGSSMALLLFDAHTFQEYSEGFFGWASATFTFVGLLGNVLQTDSIFSFIGKMESTIDERKFSF